MDSHYIARGRGSVEDALKLIKAKCLFIGLESDILFPIKEQKYLSENVADGEFKVIDSIYGHDGFLLEPEQLTEVIREFYLHKTKKKSNHQVA